MTKSGLLMSCAAGALALTAGFAVAAPASAPAAPVSAAPEATTIGEIVVTAEKREANLQNVPEAVTAFTAKERNIKGISTVQDLTNFTPGFTYSSQLDRPAMRGLAKNNNIYLADSAVAIYYDDFYSTSTFLVGRDDMLIDQVEILLGPQGTLYGRNAIGGLINTISKKPTDHLSGEVRAIVGNYGFTQFEGTISAPITDKISFRLSGYDLNQTNGYFHNLVPGMPTEGQVRHDPYVDFQLQYKDDKNEVWLDANTLAFNNDRGGPGAVLGTPTTGSYDIASTGSGNIVYNPNYPYGGGAAPGSVVGQIGTNNPALQNIRDFAHAVPTDVNLNAAFGFIFHYIHHFDGFDMKYVGGYSQYHYDLKTSVAAYGNSPITSYQLPVAAGLSQCLFANLNGIPCGPLTVRPTEYGGYDSHVKWWSSELTFSSTTNNPLQWIAGVYYYHEQDDNPTTAQMSDQPQMSAPVTLEGTPAIANPGRYFAFEDYQDTVQSVAGYGQLDWKITPTVKLTGGLRYTYDKKNGIEETRFVGFNDLSPGTGLLYGTGGLPICNGHNAPYCTLPPGAGYNAGNLGSLLPAFDLTTVLTNNGVGANGQLVQGVTCKAYLVTSGTYAGDQARCLGDTSDAVTGTAGIEWTPDSDTLVYARYNRGYKAFGLNAGIGSATPYAAPEYVNDVEIGLKKTIGRTLTIDADAFYYNYQNDQVPIAFPQGTAAGVINLTQFVNIPTALSDGVELAVNWRPIRHLSLSLTYGFNYTSIQTGCSAADVAVLNAGGRALNAACYIDAADPQALAPGARPVGGPTATGDRYQAVNGDALPQAPRNKIALNANYTWVTNPGNLTLSGTFIWKDVSYASVFNQAYDTAPAWDQVDLRAVWSGSHDRYEVVLFMKNVFNTLGYDAALPAFYITPVGGGANTQAAEYDLTPPRTYGLELHYKF